MKIANNILELVGGTPLVRLNKINDSKAEVLAKLEFFNPSGSVKDRAALAMVEDAEKKGLLKKGGLLVSDNVLQDGDVLESRFAVTRRNRTIHARMREYLYALTHHEQLETVILPVGDGVSISTKAV